MSIYLVSPEKGRSLPPVEMVGGKGYGLYWLMTNGFPVPPTWVLTAEAFDRSLQRMELQEAIGDLEQQLLKIGGNWGKLQQWLDQIEPLRLELSDRLTQSILPDPVAQVLEKLVLMPTQWAVRSSATAEDRSGQSLAGQFLSLLSVPAGRPLWDAIRKVWASVLRREALSYCALRNIPLPRMAVILQPMEPIKACDRSGAAFSRSPVPNMPGVLIQVAYGAGEAIGKGYGGDLYSVEGEEVRVQRMPPPQIWVTGSDGYLMTTVSPPDPPLTKEEAQQLAALVVRTAGAWGAAVNVEFIWLAGQALQLVQIRAGI